MNSKILPLIIFGLLLSSNKSSSNKIEAVDSKSISGRFKPVNLEEQIMYNLKI